MNSNLDRRLPGFQSTPSNPIIRAWKATLALAGLAIGFVAALFLGAVIFSTVLLAFAAGLIMTRFFLWRMRKNLAVKGREFSQPPEPPAPGASHEDPSRASRFGGRHSDESEVIDV